MFTNETGGISGNLPDLLSHLEGAYRRATKQPEGLKIGASEFLNWAKKYLTEHRPSEVFAVNDNFGVQLTNGLRIKLCPASVIEAKPSGDMANPDNSISITRPR